MRKVILPIIILSLLFGTVSFAQEAKLPSPGLTPDSLFYFLDTFGERLGMFFTFGAEKKAKKAMQYTEEKLAELKAMAEKNKTQALEGAIQKYQEFLGLANQKIKEAKEKGKDVEELAILIIEKTLKHQEILVEVFEKVPEEAKTAIQKAIEVSRRGSEEAIQAVTGAKKEELLQKIEEVKIKVETADWKTYKNEKYGYSFKYPLHCFYGPMPVYCKEKPPEERPSECLCFLNGENPDEVFLQGNISKKGWPDFSIRASYYDLPGDAQIISWLREKFKNFSWYENIPDQPNIEIGGISAVKVYQLGSNSDKPEEYQYQIWATDEIYFIKDNKLFVIQMLDVDSKGGRAFYDLFLSTFKFIELERAGEEAPKIEEVPRVEEKPTAPNTPMMLDIDVSTTAGKPYTIGWRAVEEAINYILERDTNSSFANPIIVSSRTLNSFSGTLSPSVSTRYYFRVKACNSYGCSSWSKTTELWVEVIIPSPPPLEEKITVNSPNGGEVWKAGNTYTIFWESTVIVNGLTKVRINLLSQKKDDPSTYIVTNIASEVDVAKGFYSWRIPTEMPCLSLPCLPLADYPCHKIEIIDSRYGRDSQVPRRISDESNGCFKIEESCPLPEAPVLTDPGISVKSGESFGLSWTCCIGGTLQRDTDPTFPNPSQVYAGQSLSPAKTTTYYYRVNACNDCGCSAWSNIVDMQVIVPSITVTSPNGGERFDQGANITITWNSKGVDYVDIDLLDWGRKQEDGSAPFILDLVTNYSASKGSYTWKIYSDWPTGNLYKIRVASSDNLIKDTSDNYFSIVAPGISSITVISPNGGEVWKTGETRRITWNSVGVGSVHIYITDQSILGSGSTNYITPNGFPVIALTGYYNWTIPIFHWLPGSGGMDHTFKIRIFDASNASIQDYSDNFFSILPNPPLTLISPNGGEILEKGKTYTIRWDGSSFYGFASIQINLIDGSVSPKEKMAIAKTTNTGSYTWTVPETIKSGWLFKIEIYVDDAGPGKNDLSDNTFSILPSPPPEP